MGNTAPVLQLQNIVSGFGEVMALRGVSIDIFPGEVHALIGEHGAGKSTLASVMSGYVRPRSGTIIVDGKEQMSYSLRIAKRLGLRMVYQQSQLVENVTVADNIYHMQGDFKSPLWYSRRRKEQEIKEYLEQHGIFIGAKTLARNLTPSDKTVVDFLKNILIQPKVFILDEALERLSNDSLIRMKGILKSLKQNGAAIVIITHRIDDVYDLADRVTVLKDGVKLLTAGVDDIAKINLIRVAYTQFEEDTDPQEADHEFQKYIRFNDAILQRLPVNIVVVDPLLQLKLVNESCRRSFQLKHKKIGALSLRDILRGSNSVLEEIEHAILSEQQSTFYNITLGDKQDQRVYNIKTSPIRDSDIVIGTVVLIEDVTEFEELQNNVILTEKLASVGLLAAGVAHEINNPLEIIVNHLSFLKYKTRDPSLVSEGLEKIRTEINDISSIVSNLVTFSEAKSPQMEAADLNCIIQELISLLRFNVEYQHVRIFFDRYEEEVFFYGIRDQMKQVILNLVKNSLEAMPHGGEIHIRTYRDIDKSLAIMTFEDDGPGIDAVNPSDVFTPFYSTRTDRPSSMGLGLSISHRIVSRFGGTMQVRNLPERGCRFTISLRSAD